MDDDKFLWYEINDTVDEHLSYLNNEIKYFLNIFTKNKMESLLDITIGFKDELLNIEKKYESTKRILDVYLDLNVPSAVYYKDLLKVKDFVYYCMDNLKYITYSIFDTNVRKRIEHVEMMKNHQIARNLCKHLFDKIDIGYKVSIESHFGYDNEYYCVPLYQNTHGIINAPRNTLFCTRLLPINSHEVAHLAIDIK